MTPAECDKRRMAIWIACDHPFKTWRNGAAICDACHKKVQELERLYRAQEETPQKMSTRKHNEPFRAAGTTLGDAMREYAGDCHCDEPEPGESGVIVCTNCALLTWAEEADALLNACKAALSDLVEHDEGAEYDWHEATIAKLRAAIKEAEGKP